MMSFLFYTTIVIFIFVCLFMILLILIQKGRGGGLASAFGGAGGNTAFGSKTGDVLTWATSIVFGIFLLLAVALNLFAEAQNRAEKEPKETKEAAPIEVPVNPEAPAATRPTIPSTLPSTAPSTSPSTAPSTAPSTRSATTTPATRAAPKEDAKPQAAASPAPSTPTPAIPAPPTSGAENEADKK